MNDVGLFGMNVAKLAEYPVAAFSVVLYLTFRSVSGETSVMRVNADGRRDRH